MLKQSIQAKYQLLAVTFLRSRGLCKHLLALKKERIVKLYQTQIVMMVLHSHCWSDEDHAFDYQLYQWSVDKLFQTSGKLIIRQLKLYVED